MKSHGGSVTPSASMKGVSQVSSSCVAMEGDPMRVLPSLPSVEVQAVAAVGGFMLLEYGACQSGS